MSIARRDFIKMLGLVSLVAVLPWFVVKTQSGGASTGVQIEPCAWDDAGAFTISGVTQVSVDGEPTATLMTFRVVA